MSLSQSHNFARITPANLERSKLNRSSRVMTTLKESLLVPIFVDEVLPGDTCSLRMHTFCRLATLLHPIMDDLSLSSFFFFVPNRLLWDNFQKFNGEQTDPGDSTEFTVPQITIPGGGLSSSLAYETLEDYFGIPPQAVDLEVNALHFRAYNLIWNEWFRDENLQDSVVVDTGDAASDIADYVLLPRGKRHDYFSSSLPWPQKGDAVNLPLGVSAPIVSSGDGIPSFDIGTDTDMNLYSFTAQGEVIMAPTPGGGSSDLSWNTTALEADLSLATGATINSLRNAFQIQKLYERDARGGSRYTEIVRSHFGVISPDARLQRPEYLGGGKQSININPVPYTTLNTNSEIGAGDLGAYGTSASSNHSWNKSFTEHGVIIGLISIQAPLSYQQGLNRMWSRQTRWDFYWPALSHIGEQAVLLKEIYAQGTDDIVADESVWGYQGRFDEYRYKENTITGHFRSTSSLTLDSWHLAQRFNPAPTLGADFIVDDAPVSRVIKTPEDSHFIFDAQFDYNCVRPMPAFATPGMIDHF